MNNKESVVQTAGSCKIVDINSYRGSRKAGGKEQTEEWLRKQVHADYGDDDGTVLSNPLLRISTKFDALSIRSQQELYGYAKGRIMGIGEDISLRDRLWSVLEKGSRRDGSWSDVEEFADALLNKEGTCRQAKRGAY